MLVAGFAAGFATEALLRPVAGNQLYELAPLAVNGVDVPAQIVVPALTLSGGSAVTVTVTVVVPEQLPVVPVTV